MKHLPEDIRGAVVGFMVNLSKGLLDDGRWDWDVELFDWQHYREGFADPSILRTTLSVFLNNLRLDDNGAIMNYLDARFRGMQYFRAMIDKAYPVSQVSPPFDFVELEEPDWRIWD